MFDVFMRVDSMEILVMMPMPSFTRMAIGQNIMRDMRNLK